MSELRGLSSMAVRGLLAELAALYARQASASVTVESIGGVDAERRTREGEAFDFVVLARDAIDRLAAEGHVVAGSRADIAHSGIAVAVRKGEPHLAIDSEDAVRLAVTGARTIGYSTGPSGRHVLSLLDRWGVAGAVEPRLVRAPAGVGVGTLVARGEAQIGFQQASEFQGVGGIDVLGPLPDPIQSITVFSGAVCATCARSGDARDFLRFLGSAEAAPAKRRHGMTP